MRRLWVFIVCVSILNASNTFAYANGMVHTGEGWQDYTKTEDQDASLALFAMNIGMLRGFADAIALFGYETRKPMWLMSDYCPAANYDPQSMSESLDQFYSIPENLAVPIFWAVRLVQDEQNGEPKNKVEAKKKNMLALLAKMVSEAKN